MSRVPAVDAQCAQHMVMLEVMLSAWLTHEIVRFPKSTLGLHPLTAAVLSATAAVTLLALTHSHAEKNSECRRFMVRLLLLCRAKASGVAAACTRTATRVRLSGSVE